jgi:excisionase family DNA binding protein
MRGYAGIWSLVTVRRADADTGGMSTQTSTRDGPAMLTPADAARLAKVSRDTIYREIDRGSLRALHVGGRLLRIDPSDFRRWLKGGTG